MTLCAYFLSHDVECVKLSCSRVWAMDKRPPILSLLLGAVGCAGASTGIPLQDALDAPASLVVSSPDFGDGETLPQVHAFDQFGCTGGNTAPELSWSGAPAGTQSFALVVHDPDAPTGVGFFHWVVSNLPATTTRLGGAHSLPASAQNHHTDYGASGYGGPCPPEGDSPHRYVFTVYALDTPDLGLPEGATGALVRFVVAHHTLAYGRLLGTYSR